jgi:hypothetical protein
VLTDLAVAPLGDAGAIAATSVTERRWPREDVKGLGREEPAAMHCLIDWRTSLDPVAPPSSALSVRTR